MCGGVALLQLRRQAGVTRTVKAGGSWQLCGEAWVHAHEGKDICRQQAAEHTSAALGVGVGRQQKTQQPLVNDHRTG